MAIAKAKVYTEKDYYNLPEGIRAEIINGEIIYNFASPSRKHQKISGNLFFEIQSYIRKKEGSCEVYAAPFAVKLFNDDKTITEPDISVICDPNKLTEKGCSGAPDWIIEIVSPGSLSRDYIKKLNLYKEAGVREYWIADPLSEKITVYCLEEENFNINYYTFNDKVKANIYDDLYIDFSKINLN